MQGCRNLANPAGDASLGGLAALRRLTSLSLRGCDRLTGATTAGATVGGEAPATAPAAGASSQPTWDHT